MALNAKQRRFVEEYLLDLNATQAATRAGYSQKTARAIGARLLTNVDIQQAIQVAMQDRSEQTGITAARVLSEIGRLAFADIRKIFTEDGQLRPVHELPEEVAASISSVEVVTSKVPGGGPTEVEYTSKIKFWDKRGSLELLGKHLKLFTDKTEVTGPGGGPIEHRTTVVDEKAVKAAVSKLAGEY